jgi:hypothetical protein
MTIDIIPPPPHDHWLSQVNAPLIPLQFHDNLPIENCNALKCPMILSTHH